jgi:hypothetical protein
MVRHAGLIKKLTDLHPLSSEFHFGLHLDSEGHWTEPDLAEFCVQEIIALKIRALVDSAAVLLLFLRRRGLCAHFVPAILASPDLNPRMREILSGVPPRSEGWISWVTPTLSVLMDAVNRTSENFVARLIDAFDEGENHKKFLFSRNVADLTLSSRHQTAVARRLAEDGLRDNRKRWFHLWNQLAFDGGPWEAAVISDLHVRKWKRDGVLCCTGIPVKVKPNGSFDDHFYASLCRDAGSNRRADAILEQLRESRPEVREVPPLLQLSSDSTKPQNVSRELSDLQPIRGFQAVYIKPDAEKPCQFQIFERHFQLIFEQSKQTKLLPATSVHKILYRGILHRPIGIEIFVKNSRSFLLAFSEVSAFEVLHGIASLRSWNLVLVQTEPSKPFFKSLKLTERWVAREISTFDYLLWLNHCSGRSFNDARMYPVFPWVLRDYESPVLDLSSPATFRDLSRPMGALDPARLLQLKTRCVPPDSDRGRYLYSAGYSSPLCVFIWLVRVEPYTSMHIKAQSGKFDVPARLFTSVGGAYDLASTTVGDYRELIPEFFYDYLFLLNTNRFNLGELRGEALNDVELPPWAHGNPIEFVYVHRKALESERVSDAIHQWIDLIWGFRQTGPAAVDADNVFNALLYENVWNLAYRSLQDLAKEIEATLDSCGQIPQQLFTDPHPPRSSAPRARVFESTTVLYTGLGALNLIDVVSNVLLCQSGSELMSIGVHFNSLKQPFVNTRIWPVRLPPFKRLAALAKRKVCALLHTGELAIVRPTDIRAATIDLATGLSGQDDLICLATTGTSITVCRDLEVLHIFPSFRDEIVCSAVSAAFDLVVVGARKSALFIISPSHRSMTRVIDLAGKNPVFVTITSGWGFIVVYAEQLGNGFIELFTVNGDFIRSVKVGFAVSCWSTWTSTDGFDYLIVAPESGALRVCEVFYLAFHLLPEMCSGARAVFYSVQLGVVFVNQPDGQILMIPYSVTF